jgi:peptidoglycan/LPS O-acetylase OafA/YrhL
MFARYADEHGSGLLTTSVLRMTWELSNLLRAIATTIVISIHASHSWWFGVKDTVTINPEIFIDTIINQVGRFTVPMFVILSGFALSQSEVKRPFDSKTFCQRRLGRIVPPYILFTLLNLVGRSQFLTADWQERFQQIWQALSTGMGDYHLYFLGIIWQCYISYPFLRRLDFTVKKLYILPGSKLVCV